MDKRVTTAFYQRPVFDTVVKPFPLQEVEFRCARQNSQIPIFVYNCVNTR